MQINISRGGLPKRPVPSTKVTPLGLEGDGHNHPQIHGGTRKAILLIGREAVDELESCGYPVFYGALGENFTTAGLDRRSMRSGQRYRIGSEVVIELTTPRKPCRTLDIFPGIQDAIWDKLIQDGETNSPKWGMGGFYASVVAGGLVLPGAPILLLDQLA